MLGIFLCIQCFKVEHNISDRALLQTGVRVFITQTGLSKYCNKNAEVAIGKIQSTLILPEINLKILSFDVSLRNGKFTELSIKDIDFHLDEDRATLVINDITIVLVLEMEIVQKTFPYLYDSGSATLSILKLKLQTDVDEFFTNETCPNIYTLVTSRSFVQPNTFTINVDSGLSIILNSFFSLFSENIKDLLNGEVGQSLAGTISSELIKLLTSQAELSRISYDFLISTDQRYFKGLTIKKNFLIVDSTGQRCILNGETNQCLGWYYSEIKSPPVYYSNNDVQYQIERTAFNSGFKLYLEDPREIENIKILNITLTRFYNTGAQLIVEISINGIIETLEFLEPVKFLPVRATSDIDFGSFDIQFTRLISVSSLSQDELKSLASYFRDTFSYYQLSYGNALGVSEEKAVTVYLDEDWIMVMSDID